jgi:hypothetical protein
VSRERSATWSVILSATSSVTAMSAACPLTARPSSVRNAGQVRETTESGRDGPLSVAWFGRTPHPARAATVAGVTAETLIAARELDSRVSDGVYVTLLWNAEDDQVFVTLADERTGEAHVIPVGAGERALDVFLHPYAYAAAA